MSARETELAAALLDAHVAYVRAQLEGEGLANTLRASTLLWLAEAREVTLGEIVDRNKLKQSLRRYAQDLQPGAALADLLTEFTHRIYAEPLVAQTPAAALMTTKTVEALVDEALALQSLRERLVRACIESPLYARFASELLYNGIKDYLAQNALTDSIPGARSMLKLGKAVMSRATPNLESSVEESLKRYIAKSIGGVSQRSVAPLIAAENNAFLRDTALALWEEIRTIPFGELRRYVASEDLASFANLLWDEGQTLRRTELFAVLMERAVDVTFDHYGKRPVAALLQDFGIDQTLILRELMLHAPKLLRGLQRRNVLERMIRQQLEGFYRSPAFAGVIQAFGATFSGRGDAG